MTERKLMSPKQFIEESNRIEGIFRPPTKEEIAEYQRFMKLNALHIEELERFISVYQPGAKLRDQVGMNVKVGQYRPPAGNPDIRVALTLYLGSIRMHSPWKNHYDFEKLHPFMDGNGRLGRMIWAWQMGEGNFPLGFLHHFYYQTLDR